MDLAWLARTPWDWIVIGVSLAVAAAALFVFSFGAYHRRYFFDRALRLALLRTVGWLVLYGGTFALVFWLLSRAWPAGWTRYVVGGAAWWVVKEAVLGFAWRLYDAWLEA